MRNVADLIMSKRRGIIPIPLPGPKSELKIACANEFPPEFRGSNFMRLKISEAFVANGEW